jgi:hypothetical protein
MKPAPILLATLVVALLLAIVYMCFGDSLLRRDADAYVAGSPHAPLLSPPLASTAKIGQITLWRDFTKDKVAFETPAHEQSYVQRSRISHISGWLPRGKTLRLWAIRSYIVPHELHYLGPGQIAARGHRLIMYARGEVGIDMPIDEPVDVFYLQIIDDPDLHRPRRGIVHTYSHAKQVLDAQLRQLKARRKDAVLGKSFAHDASPTGLYERHAAYAPLYF